MWPIKMTDRLTRWTINQCGTNICQHKAHTWGQRVKFKQIKITWQPVDFENFNVQNGESCQEIPNCSNFKLIVINLPKFQRKLVYLISPSSFKLFSEHSCQVVLHGAPKLPGTGNTFNSSFFSKIVVTPL